MKKFLLLIESTNPFAPNNSFFERLRNMASEGEWPSSKKRERDPTWKHGFDHVMKEIYADSIEDARIMADNIILLALPKYDMPFGVKVSLMELANEVECDVRATWLKHSKVKS